jgi:hypothetical protein
MDEVYLISRVASLTGHLSPTSRTPRGALDRARRFVTEALVNNQAEPIEVPPAVASSTAALEDLAPDVREDIRRVVRDVLVSERDASLRVALRRWPVPSSHARARMPAWAGGWEPESSFGPFESADGDLVWVDVRRVAAAAVLADAQTGRPLMSLPAAAIGASSPGSVSDVNIPAGSVWFAAQLFDPSALPHSCFGVRVLAGTLRLSHPAAVQGTRIVAASGVVATVQLDLDHPTLPAEGHGGDARHLSVTLPRRATFTLAVGATAALIDTAPVTVEIYGERLELRHRAAQARYDHLLSRLCFPISASGNRLAIHDTRSRVFRPSGKAGIDDTAWAFRVAVPQGTDPLTLGGPAASSAIAIFVRDGLRATVATAADEAPIDLTNAALVAQPGQLAVVASTAPLRYRRVLGLWNDRGGRSRIELRASEPIQLQFDATLASGGSEALSLSALECRADLDRPLTAGGQRVPFTSREAILDVLHIASERRIAIEAASAVDEEPHHEHPPAGRSFALSNALVRTSDAGTLQAGGVLNDEDEVVRGVVTLQFGLGFLVPTLPDPYAANIARNAPRFPFDRSFVASAPRLAARIRWNASANPELSFDLRTSGDAAFQSGLLPLSDREFHDPAGERRNHVALVENRFPRATGQQRESFRLLDVSSRADLFGVGYATQVPDLIGEPGVPNRLLQLRGLDLLAPTQNVSAFTLPAFQWEPVYNIPAAGQLPFPSRLISPTDGGPTRFAMPSATLVPVAPLPVIDTLLSEYGEDARRPLAVRFTLPFGMVAVAVLRPASRPLLPVFASPRFERVRPRFVASKLTGGLQVSLHAAVDLTLQAGGPSPGLPGAAAQANNAVGGMNVLKSGLVDEIFNGTFADVMPMVPVQRIDFSGYGGTTFSDWRHPDVQGAGVTQVKFETPVGRTSREVVQVRSKLYPWGAIVVRIITIERTGSGGVFRRDSGWQAASDGDYRLGPGCVVHAGVVRRLTNIRRIRDTTNIYERDYATGSGTETVKLTQVIFDADVEIEGVTLGANPSRLVPARDIVGYVQALPIGKDLTPEQLDDLLSTTGPIGGPLDCELNIAQSGLHMRLARIEVDRTRTLGGNPQFVAAARGTAELPATGQWSFSYRTSADPEPHRLESNRPVPLIRENPGGGVNPPYRFAEPADLHRPSPEFEYGLVFSSDAQRLLIPQPHMRWGDAAVHGAFPLLFADMYALGGCSALLPRSDFCHPLPANTILRLIGRAKVRLDIPPQPGLGPGEFKIGALERTISDTAALRVRARFHPDSRIKLTIDSDLRPDWSCAYGPVSVVSDIDGLEDLVEVIGEVTSAADAAPTVRDPHMGFGGPLAPVKPIISFLTNFGVPFPMSVSITNHEYTFKSGTKYTFPPPGLDALFLDEAIESGLGVMLRLELIVGVGTETETADELKRRANQHKRLRAKAQWDSHLEFTAKMLIKVASIELISVFLGGASKVEFIGKSDGTSEVALHYGVAGVIEVDLKIVELSGGRTFNVVSQRKGDKIDLGFSSEFEVEAELLFGLAAVGLSFEVILAMDVSTGSYEVSGTATLAFDVTVGWVCSKSYEVEYHVTDLLEKAEFLANKVLPS